MRDISRVFHHPALRDRHCELHNMMYGAVERWVHSRPDQGSNLNHLLGSDSVRHGKNHTVDPNLKSTTQGHSHGGLPSNMSNFFGNTGNFFGAGSQGKTRDSPWEQIDRARDAGDLGTGGSGVETADDDIPAVFPGTQPEFDTSRPPTGPDFGYSTQQPEQPPQQQYPSYPQQGAPQWQPGPPPQMYPPQGPPSPQPPGYGYSGAPPYGQAPPQPYGYGAPPPEPYYGGPY